MVTGVTNSNMMQSNVIGTTSNAMTQHKEVMPVKSDRRSNKPIMEKRRRARINNCLNELKTLILDATKKDPARHSKLEKADILEKTVKYLQELQRKQAVMQQASDPKVLNKFKAGFADCANEVSRFPGLDPTTKRRLLQHLSNCLNGVKTELHQHQRQTVAAAQMHTTQILPSPPSSPEQQDHLPLQHQHHHLQQHQQQQNASTTTNPYAIQQTAAGYFLPNGLQVIPTKLPNGSVALVLPQQQTSVQHQQQQQQVAMLTKLQNHSMLVPIPMRTASTSSASSHASSSCGYDCNLPLGTADISISNSYTPPSPANSYEAMEYKPTVIQHAATVNLNINAAAYFQTEQQQLIQQQQQQHSQPLSLVVRKDIIKEEEQPWRPW